MLATTLEIILKMTLHKAMGLYLSRVCALSCFGMRAIKEVLRTFKMVLFRPESSTISTVSLLTVFQQALKKSTLNPSDPGVFPFFISLRTSLISIYVTGLLRLPLSSLETSLGMCLVKFFIKGSLSENFSLAMSRKCFTNTTSISS